MTSIPFLFAVVLGQTSPTITPYLLHDLQDLSWTARIVRGEQKELQKINSDFGQAYRFESSTVRYKEPLKLRVESKADDTTVVYVINGTMQAFSISSVHLVKTNDLSKAPGRRQTPLDFGLLTPSMFNNFFQAKFVRTDRGSGDVVFDLTYVTSLNDTTRHRVWIDPQKRYIVKREWYNQGDRMLATFFYENPVKQGPIWTPTRLTVKNVDNVVAGITRYENVKVNAGIADSLFSIK